jgi:hypothetical protein
MTRRLNTIALGAVLLLLAAGCGSGGGQPRQSEAGTNRAASPPQLKSIQELRAVFNAASREPTLVVLISPT